MCKQTPVVLLILLYPWGRLSAVEDWPQFRGPDRNDASKETGLLKSWPAAGPMLLWTFRDAGAGYSGLSVVGDRLYSLGDDDATECLYAIDLKTQKKVWTAKIGGSRQHAINASEGPCSTPTIDGRFVYALGGRGRLVCVDAAKGEMIWSKDLGAELSKGGQTHYGYVESPLVDGEQVIATPGGQEGAIAAFDKRTGALKWRCAGHTDMVRCGSAFATEVGGVRQHLQATQGHVVGVRPTDGRLLWRFRMEQAVAMVCKNNCIYVSAFGGGALLKLLPLKGKFEVEEIYGRAKLCGNSGGVILAGDYLYGAGGGTWVCQNFETGRLVWRKRCGFGNSSASVTFAEGCIYGYWGENGDVQLIQPTPAGFKEKGNFRIPEESIVRKSRRRVSVHPADIWPRPVLANGKLYLRDHEVIFCYDVRTAGRRQ